MPSRPQFSTDDSVKIVAWWYELKDIHKVHCDTPRTKALNVSRGSCWAGKSSSMLLTDSRRLAVSRWSGQSDTRRNLWQRMKKTLKRWETWSPIMSECQSIRYQLRQIFQSHQESQAQDPRGPHGGCEQGITHGVRETLNLPLIRTFLSKYSMPWPLSELLKLTHGYTMNISGSAIFIEWLSSTENSSIYCCFLNELSTICSFFVFWAQHIQSLGLS